jgi:hypothetical protein
MEQRHREPIVAVGEDIGLDDHGVADETLDGEAAAVDHRRHALDHDPSGCVQGGDHRSTSDVIARASEFCKRLTDALTGPIEDVPTGDARVSISM